MIIDTATTEKFRYVCQKAVFENPKGLSVKEIASALDKSPSTLYGELNPQPNPNGCSAKLGALDLFQIMTLTQAKEPIQFQASHFACRLVPVVGRPDGRNMDDECLQILPAVSRFIEAARNGGDFESLSPLLEEAIKELQDVWIRRREENLSGLRGAK